MHSKINGECMQINIDKNQQKNFSARHNEKGFTMLELVVSMIIFTIFLTSIWGVLDIGRKSRTAVSQKVQSTKSVRFALNMIGRDTYNAGYGYPVDITVVLKNNALSNLLGTPNDSNPTRDEVPPIIAGNNLTLNTFNTTAGVRTDQVTFLYKEPSFNMIGVAPDLVSQPLNINAATTSSSIDEIIPISGSNVSCRVNDILLINGNSGSTLGVVTALQGTNIIRFANGDVLNFNKTGATGSLRGITTPASMHRVKMVTYFVTADGTLMRRDFANSAAATSAQPFVDEPLVYGVEDFQIQYVLDVGTVSDNPSAGPDGIPGNADDSQSILNQVRQIRYTISVRSTELDQKGQPYRTSMSTTYSTRNLGYDAN